MPGGIGYSFSPLQSDDPTKGPAPESVQQAVQVLGLRLPTVSGARALAPQPLLNAPGASGLTPPGGLSLQQFLQMLFGQNQPAQPMGMPATGRAPLPNITPGTSPTPQPLGPTIDRTSPAPGNRGTPAPRLSAGPQARRAL